MARFTATDEEPCDFCETAIEGEIVAELPAFAVDVADVGEVQVVCHICNRCLLAASRALSPRARGRDPGAGGEDSKK